MKLEIHHYHHYHFDDLGDVLKAIHDLERKISTMATKADFDSVASDMTAALATVQQRIADLTTRVNGGGMTADEENAALAEMQQLRDQLNGVANPPAPTP